MTDDVLHHRIGCPDCDSNICVTLPRIFIELQLGDEFEAEMVRQILLDGWLLVDGIPLCPTCADSEIAVRIGGR